MKTRSFYPLMLAIISILFFSCKKSNSDSSQMKVRMTDAPALYDEVNIDLQSVEVKFAKDTTHWATMQTNAGVYNLLGLQNGVDTLIAQGSFQTDMVKEIRLVLGTNNTIKVSGVVYPLTVPSGAETGLKIKVDEDLGANLTTLLVDFDTNLSINAGAQGYFLVPVLRLK